MTRRHGRMDSVELIELQRVEEIYPWADQWDALARATDQLVFQSSAWAASWWSILEPTASMTLAVHRDGAAIDGLLALSRLQRRFHWRVPAAVTYLGLAGSGIGAADHLGPIASDPAVADALLASAVSFADGLPLVLSNVDPSHQAAVDRLGGAKVITSTPCPSVDLRDRVDPESTWSASRRGDIRRCLRRVADAGFRQEWTRFDGHDTSRFDELVALHRQLWNARCREGVLGTRKQAFLIDLAQRLDATDGAGAWIQTIGNDDGAIAAMLAFQFGGTMCSYATGWDPQHRRLGLGILLEAGGLTTASERGLHRYDFLRGTEQHKLALGGRVETDVTYCQPNGLLGHALFGRDRLLEHHRPAWQSARTGGLLRGGTAQLVLA